MVKLNKSKILILTIIFAVAIAIIFTIHPFFNISTAQQPIVKDPKLKVEVFAHGLNSPTNMAFLDRNHILVLEKGTGAVRLILNGQLHTQPVLKVAVNSEVERGLLGIATDGGITTQAYAQSSVDNSSSAVTTIAKKNYVFLYDTEESRNGQLRNRVYRYQWNGTNLVNPILILDLPALPGPNHDGGKLLIGPAQDHYLYAIIGDLNHRGQLQNINDGPAPDNTSVIIGINPIDGSPAKNNPFVNANSGSPATTTISSNIRYYYAYGIRNSFGLAFDPITGNLWDTENGEDVYDEINLVKTGFNSGWIQVMGPIARNGISEDHLVKFPGFKYIDPVFSWKNVVAVTGIEFLNSSKLGDKYKDNVFVGDYNNGNLYFFKLNNTRTGFNFHSNSNQQLGGGTLSDLVADNDRETSEVTFGTGFGAITDLKTGPDGYLYIVSIVDGNIYRILPATTNVIQ
jgi:aldose sugar dehydrogenase